MKVNYKCIPFTLWDSMAFRSLSNIAKLVFLYLIASPATKIIGISKVNLDWISFFFHLSKKRLVEYIRAFEEHNLLVFCEETSEIYLKNYLVVYAQRGGPPLIKTLRREFVGVENRELLRRCIADNRSFMTSRPDYYNKTIDGFLAEAELLLRNEGVQKAQTEANDQGVIDHPNNPEADRHLSELREYFDRLAEEEAERLNEEDDRDEGDLPF